MNDQYLYEQLLTKVLTGQATAQERQQFQDWAQSHPDHQRLVDDTMRVWEWSEQYGQNTTIDTDAAWNRFEQRIQPSSLHRRPRFLAWAITVVGLALLVGLGWWWMRSDATPPILQEPAAKSIFAEVQTPLGQQRTLILPDGSKVLLNGGSTLRYLKEFEPRHLQLEGEAYFDVVSNLASPFSVATPQIQTTVLGTVFSIRAYAKEPTEVAVMEGKVSVQSNKPLATARIILPGEVAVHQHDNERVDIHPQAGNNAFAWTTKELNFNNQPLKVVVEDLERYFGVTIKGDQKLLNCRYTGTFKDPTLEEVLQTIAFTFPSGIEIKPSDDQQEYQLEGKGCD